MLYFYVIKDDQSLTIKLRDGGSRIVFYSDQTSIGKFDEGFWVDLQAGQQVTISGTENSDGSITANSIQIRPDVVPSPSSDI